MFLRGSGPRRDRGAEADGRQKEFRATHRAAGNEAACKESLDDVVNRLAIDYEPVRPMMADYLNGARAQQVVEDIGESPRETF